MKRRSTFGWLDLLRGILFLVLGIVTICKPNIALTGLVIFYGIIAIISGIAEIVLYARLRKHTGLESKVALVTGMISTLAGVLLLLNPVIGKWIFNFAFAIWFITHCVSRIVDYDFTRHIAGKAVSIVLLCLNILGLLLGILMIFNPLLFSVSLGVLIAVTLIIIGVSSIIEAFSDMGASDVL